MTVKNRLRLGAAVLLALMLSMGAVCIMNLQAGPRLVMGALVMVTALVLMEMWFLTVRAITQPLSPAQAVPSRGGKPGDAGEWKEF